jgi:hypothetical protein
MNKNGLLEIQDMCCDIVLMWWNGRELTKADGKHGLRVR